MKTTFERFLSVMEGLDEDLSARWICVDNLVAAIEQSAVRA